MRCTVAATIVAFTSAAAAAVAIGIAAAQPSASDAVAEPSAGAAAPAPSPADASAAAPAPVTVRVRLEPDTTTIGTPFRYVTEITAPTGMQVVLSQPTERIGVFDILDFGDAPPVTHAGMTTITRWYRLAGWQPGHYEIISPPVQWRAGDAPPLPAAAVTTIMTIESVLAKAGAPSDLRDIKPPLEPPFYALPYYVASGILAAALVVGLAASRVLRRRRRGLGTPPPRPPHEVAVEELERLRGRGLTEHGLFKEYYSALSGIVRRYLEHRFSLRAPEMTTEEFLLATARGGRLQSTHRALLAEFLGECDLVKFARHVPTLANSERAWTAARRFVDETAPAAATADRDAADGRRSQGVGTTLRAGMKAPHEAASTGHGGAGAPR